ncbi:hypothetical protein J1N35_041473 [Gossypium stocksii]|uniref:Uncharacterized protein n=1 Tax=Gossypium stocksii TaxID=47602 RepID=A0A9D3ZIP4_9ROSI|nr:hypothetical protein J1N35_041473 [Gossypium stocksii]
MSYQRARSSKTSAENPIVIQDEEVEERFDSIFKNQPMMLEKVDYKKYGSHSCQRECLKPLAKVWFYFVRYSFMLISHSSTISKE